MTRGETMERPRRDIIKANVAALALARKVRVAEVYRAIKEGRAFLGSQPVLRYRDHDGVCYYGTPDNAHRRIVPLQRISIR